MRTDDGPPAATSSEMSSPIYSQGWGALTAEPLICIMRSVLEHYDNVRDIVQAWENLARVCKHWMHTARRTPLCLALSHPTHLQPGARQWLANGVMEVLILSKSMHQSPRQRGGAQLWPGGGILEWQMHQEMQMGAGEFPGQAAAEEGEEEETDEEEEGEVEAGDPASSPTPGDLQLFADPLFIANSASVLSGAVNLSLHAAPLLLPFRSLRQVSLFSSTPAPGRNHVNLKPLADLPLLTCLSIAGYFDSLAWMDVPTTLRHLSVSLYSRRSRSMLIPTLPAAMTRLEYLSVKAECVIIDWSDALERCEEVHIAGHIVCLGLGASEALPGILDNGPSVAGAYIQRFCMLTAAATVMDRAVITFDHVLSFWAGPGGTDNIQTVGADVNEFVAELRRHALGRWDVNPTMERPANFIRDSPALGECFILGMDRQDGPEPRSYHFTTPIVDSERALLLEHPVWKLAWCDDPNTKALLHDPQFVQNNAHVLWRLAQVNLEPGLDLRPFVALRSLSGVLFGGRIDEVQLPLGLTSLQLEARVNEPNVLHPGLALEDVAHRFSASTIKHLPRLKDLALGRWYRHDLSRLPRSVTSVRISSPTVAYPEILDNTVLRFPMPEGQPRPQRSRLGASRLLRFMGIGTVLDWSDEDDYNAPPPPAAPAQHAEQEEEDDVAGPSSAGGADAGAPLRLQRRRRRQHRHFEDGLDAGYASDVSSEYLDGSGSEDESEALLEHGRQSCRDPHCPVHSGKRHLQIMFSDHGPDWGVNLVDLLASGFPMLTLSMNPILAFAPDQEPFPFTLHLIVGDNWQRFADALRSSCVEVLEINTHLHVASFDRRPQGRIHHTLVDGLQALEAACSDVFSFKTWDGTVARDGVHPLGHGYAIIRRMPEVAEHPEGGAVGEGPSSRGATAGDIPSLHTLELS